MRSVACWLAACLVFAGCNCGQDKTRPVEITGVTVEAGPKNPADSAEPAGLADLPLLQLRVGAQADATKLLRSLSLSIVGNADALESVALLVDANEDGVVGPDDTRLAQVSAGGSTVTFEDLSRELATGYTGLLIVGKLKATAKADESIKATLPTASSLLATTVDGEAVPTELITATVTLGGGRKTLGATGTLLIAPGPQTPAASTTSPARVNLPVLQFELSMPSASAEGAKVTAINLALHGTVNDPAAISQVRLYRDVNANGAIDGQQDLLLGTASSVSADNGVVTFSGLTETVPAGTLAAMLVLVDLSGGGSTGQTLAVGVAQNGVSAVGLRSGLSLPTAGSPVTGTLKTLDSGGGLFVSAGLMNPAFSSEPVGATGVPMLQLALKASVGQPVRVNQLTLRASGFGDDQTGFAAVRLYKDANANGLVDSGDTVLGAPTTVTGNDGTASFTGLAALIPAGETHTWLVVADFSATVSPTESYALSFPTNENLVAVDPSSGVPLLVGGAPLNGGLKTISSQGSATIALGVNAPGPSNESPTALDVPMLQFSLTASAVEAVRMTSLTLRASGSADDALAISTVHLYRDVDGNGLVDGATDTALGVAQSYTSDNGTVIFNGLSEVVAAGGKANFVVTYDLSGSAQPGQTFSASIALSSAVVLKGVSSAATITPGGTAGGSLKTIQSLGSLTFSLGTNNPPASAEFSNAQRLPLLQLRAIAGSADSVRITKVVATGAGTANDVLDVTGVRLYRDVDASGSVTVGDVQLGSTASFALDNGIVQFSGLTEVVPAGGSVTLLFAYDLAGTGLAAQTFDLRLANAAAVTAEGVTSLAAATVAGLPLQSGAKTLKGATLTLATGVANPGATTELATAADVPMMQVKLTASAADAVKVAALTLNVTGSLEDSTGISQVRLYRDVDANGRVGGTDVLIAGPGAYAFDNGNLTFGGMNELVPAGASVHWLIQYVLSGTGLSGQTFDARIASNASVLAESQTTGQVAAVTGGGLTSATKTLRSATVAVALGTNTPAASSEPPNATAVPMLQFRVTGDAADAVQVNGVVVTATGGINDLTDVSEVRLYLDADADGQLSGGDSLLGSPKLFSADNGTASFLGLNQALAAGASLNLLVVYDLSGSAAAGGVFDARLASAAGVVAVSQASGQAVTVTGAPVIGSSKTIATQFNTWSTITRTGAPRPRANHTAVSDGTRMIVFGGEDQSGELGDGASYNPSTNTWTALPTTGAPSARAGHVAAVAGGYMVVFGGRSAGAALASGARYNLSTNTWQTMSATNAPSARSHATIVAAGSSVIVWGGFNAGALGNGALYNPATDTWTSVAATGAPPSARYLHTAVWTGTEMVVWGGYNGTYLADGARYNPTTSTWTAVSSAAGAGLTGSGSHTAVWTGSEMLLWGGFRGTGYLNVGAVYNPATDAWRALATSGAPTARAQHVAVYTGSRMVTWGGYTGTAAVDTGSVIDPVFNQWLATALSGAPVPRFNHTGVWLGGRLLIWGGQSASAYLDTGGRYLP